jgi:hypothetical protein
VGSCTRAGGCVELISAGHEPYDSNFLAVDATGRNVFFTTRDRLSPRDVDGLYDLYDAREGGGIAAETETRRGECEGEACVPGVAPPVYATPGSANVRGGGNVTEAGGPGRGTLAARRARRLAARARRLRGRARKLAHRRRGAPARRAMRRSRRLGRRARKLSSSAKRCRRARAANRNRGGAR